MVNTLLITEDEALASELLDSTAGSSLKLVTSKKAEFAEMENADIIIIDTRYSNTKSLLNKPVIGLSMNGDLAENKLTFYDDLIFTPIDLDQLNLRIKRLLLISTDRKEAADKIEIGDMLIDLESYEVKIENQLIILTYKEYELLKYLASHRGRAFDRQTILNQIWDYDYYGGTRTVDVHIRRLRAKLGTKYGSMIETVRQVGYRFAK